MISGRFSSEIIRLPENQSPDALRVASMAEPRIVATELCSPRGTTKKYTLQGTSRALPPRLAARRASSRATTSTSRSTCCVGWRRWTASARRASARRTACRTIGRWRTTSLARGMRSWRLVRRERRWREHSGQSRRGQTWLAWRQQSDSDGASGQRAWKDCTEDVQPCSGRYLRRARAGRALVGRRQGRLKKRHCSWER